MKCFRLLVVSLLIFAISAPAQLAVSLNSTESSTFTATSTTGTYTLTGASFATAPYKGEILTATGLPANDFVQSVSGTTITMSAKTTTGAAVTVTAGRTFPTAATALGTSPQSYYGEFHNDNLAAGDNPGFQGVTRAGEFHVVASGTTTSFCDNSDFSQITSNLAVGWTYKVVAHYNASWSITGGAYGATGLVTSNTVATQTSGGTGACFNWTTAAPSALVANDLVELIAPAPLGQANAAVTNWNLSGGGSLSLDTTTANLPPAIGAMPQVASVQQIHSVSGSATNYYSYLDSTSSILMNGPSTQSLMVKLVSGSVSIAAIAARTTGQSFINTTASPTAITAGAWQTYTMTGSGSETAGTSGVGNAIQMQYVFTGTGVVDIIGAYLSGQMTNGGPYTHTNGSAMSDDTFAKFGLGNYDGFRTNYVGGNVMAGCGLIDLLQPTAYATQCTTSDKTYAGFVGNPTRIHEQLDFAAKRGLHRVSIAVGPNITAAEWNSLGDYLGGTCGTVFGGYRCSLGQTAPWTTIFTNITFSWNEVWNNGVTGEYLGGTPYYTSVQLGINAATALRGNSNWNPAIEHFAYPMQPSGANPAILTNVDTTGQVDRAGMNGYYTMSTATCTQPTVFQNSVAEAKGNTVDSTLQFFQMGAAAFLIQTYEAGANSQVGGCNTGQTVGLYRGLGGGIIDALFPAYLQSRWPAIFNDWSSWSFEDGPTAPYYPTSPATATTIDAWASWANNRGNASAKVYAAQLHNTCAKLGTGWTPAFTSMPTAAIAAGNAIPAETIDVTPFFAYTNGGTARCYEMWNVDTTASHTITLSGAGDLLSGTVTQIVYASHATTPALTDNNDTLGSALVVYNTTTTPTAATTYTLPPMSGLVVIGSTSGGVIVQQVL